MVSPTGRPMVRTDMVASGSLKIVLIRPAVDIRRPVVPAVRLRHTLVTSGTGMRLRGMHGRTAAAVLIATAARMLMLRIGVRADAQA